MITDPITIFNDTIPNRVVSLIPSVTDSLFSLGLGGAVAGITDYCTRPEQGVAGLPRVGGPKNPRIDEILTLAPDLVIASKDENTPAAVEAITAAGVPVWVTHPCSVQSALEDLRVMARLFRSEQALMVVAQLERSLEWELLSAAERPRLRIFCPIWQEQPANGEPWWMTFNNQTYSGDLLAVLNGENVFGGRERRYPLLADLGQAQPEDAGGRDTRFPRVTRAEVLASAPDLILLPDEPYAYGEDDIAAARGWFDQTPAGQTGRIALVDGSLLTWHGTRLAEALAILPTLFTEKP